MKRTGANTDEPNMILANEGDHFDSGGSGGVHWKMDGPDAGEHSSIGPGLSGDHVDPHAGVGTWKVASGPIDPMHLQAPGAVPDRPACMAIFTFVSAANATAARSMPFRRSVGVSRRPTAGS
jgi:hypothetical protein